MITADGASIILNDGVSPSISNICHDVARILGRGSDIAFECSSIHDPENPSRNSLEVGKLRVSGFDEFHVKLVHSPDSDSEYLPQVIKRFPLLRFDPNLLLPLIIPVHLGGCPDPTFYVHVTAWVEAEGTLAEILIRDWSQKSLESLKGSLYSFGQFLHGFHSKYPGLQHTDMNPSNILVVTDSSGISRFILTDCAGLDDQVGNDIQTFVAALQVLADGCFGDDFLALSVRAFSEGYENP
jgi:hypothetical protein